MQTCEMLILDDIGAGADSKNWMADKLYRIIEHRMDENSTKATLITANLSVEQLSDIYDQRIASRLIRRGTDKVVQVETQDFHLRT